MTIAVVVVIVVFVIVVVVVIVVFVMQGQFQQGHVKGLGLVTFADGTNGQPHVEGKFEGLELVQRCNASSAVQTAQQNASTARHIAKQL